MPKKHSDVPAKPHTPFPATFKEGDEIRYLTVGKDGSTPRHRPEGQQRGKFIRCRDWRGAIVEWVDGHVGSVLLDWIEKNPD